jgi:glutamyl-tRNA synthetase
LLGSSACAKSQKLLYLHLSRNTSDEFDRSRQDYYLFDIGLLFLPLLRYYVGNMKNSKEFKKEDCEKLAELLFPNVNTTPADWYKKYPARNRPAGAEVTRLPPSPTGFLHTGALYMGLINQRIAHDSGGLFYLRIEDTDLEREIPGARALIIEGLSKYGITFDEGLKDDKIQFGNYGPYKQSERVDIYQSFAKELVRLGKAYPCFMSKEELDALRKEQEIAKVRPGYYGQYAKWRNASMEEIQEKLSANVPYVLRFYAEGDQNVKQPFTDLFMGDIQVPQNDEDFVILKTNKIPTYHFAHVIDDRLMGTTTVVRGEEWLSSVGKHLDLWRSFGFEIPKYGHVAPINKQEGGTVRKLSKRKDPEADVMQYDKIGYPEDAIIAYLYRLANPSFDEWWETQQKNRMVSAGHVGTGGTNAGSKINLADFPFSIKELARGGRGPLLDMKKLDNISGDIIANMSATEVADRMIEWAKKYNPKFAEIVGGTAVGGSSTEGSAVGGASSVRGYLEDVLNVERDGENPRKDIVNWSQGVDFVTYFFDEYYDAEFVKGLMPTEFATEPAINATFGSELVSALSDDKYYTNPSLEAWLEDIKKLAEVKGFAIDRKKFKENPAQFKGDFATFMKIIRIALTGRDRTPNMYYVLKVMGKERVVNRLKSAFNVKYK